MNVLLVNHYPENQHEILPQVIEELRKLNGSHRYRLVHDLKPKPKHFLWTLGLPTRVISFFTLRAFEPGWATIWTQKKLTKSQEYAILNERGIATPKWTKLTREETPDLSHFSEYIVLKPDWGCCGALIRIRSKNNLRWEEPKVEKMSETISDDWIVQEYVHTGSWPVSYRVGTVFGEPIYALRITGDKKRPPFELNRKKSSRFFKGRSIVASTMRSSMDFNVPEEVLEFARSVHQAFPSIPLLGTDIIRDADTGKLYALDMNTNGSTFHLTSEAGKSVLRQFGLDLIGQFGGAKAIARGIFNRLSDELRPASIISGGANAKEHELEEVAR